MVLTAALATRTEGDTKNSAQNGAKTAVVAALVVRLDTSLFRDAVVAYDRDLRLAWVWPVPAPQSPRADPPGLAFTPAAVVLFRDGRYATGLPRTAIEDAGTRLKP